MPPPRRSKRFKNAQELSISSDNNGTPALNPATKAVNTKGLPSLPDELYLEVVSYYPTTPIPRNVRCSNRKTDDNNIRRQVLSALSQTSRNLRRFFLRYLWQRIEVYRTQHTARSRTFELVRQLETVTIRDPTLAKYVEIVNVEIGVYSRHSVLSELARCLALFPNLHTVQLKLGHDSGIKQNTIAKPFKGYIYKSVRTAIVSANAVIFLKSCPESRLVDFCDIIYCPRNFLDEIAAYCPRMKVAPRNVAFPVDRLQEIARVFPETRNLTLRGQPSPILEEIRKLKRLKVLTIMGLLDRDRVVEVWYETARKLLLDLQHTDREDKIIVLVCWGGKTETLVLQAPQPSSVAPIEV